jgi:hypothetical protein
MKLQFKIKFLYAYTGTYFVAASHAELMMLVWVVEPSCWQKKLCAWLYSWVQEDVDCYEKPQVLMTVFKYCFLIYQNIFENIYASLTMII